MRALLLLDHDLRQREFAPRPGRPPAVRRHPLQSSSKNAAAALGGQRGGQRRERRRRAGTPPTWRRTPRPSCRSGTAPRTGPRRRTPRGARSTSFSNVPDGANGDRKSRARRPTIGIVIRRISSSVSDAVAPPVRSSVSDDGVQQRPVAELAVLVDAPWSSPPAARRGSVRDRGTRRTRASRGRPASRRRRARRRRGCRPTSTWSGTGIGVRASHCIDHADQARFTLLDGHDLGVERPSDRRGERRVVLLQVAVGVVAQGAEQLGEVVVGHVGVRHQHRVLGPGPLAQHRDRRADRQQRVVPGRRAVVGDHDGPRGPGERYHLGGLFEKRYRPPQSGRLQSRGRGVGAAVHGLRPHHDTRFGHTSNGSP